MAMRTSYPAPGSSSLADGFNINLSGDAELQAMFVRLGPLVAKRARAVLDTLGRELAVAANTAAPRGPNRKGKAGGGLARSFTVLARPQWEKWGKVGVAVRSRAKYHYYQEFGVNAPNRQVVRHVTDQGKTVSKGRRYRDGTNRLRDGVRVKTYRRDIMIPATKFFGEVIASRKGLMETEAREALLAYISRIAGSGSPGEAA